jgi:hypothetical protein
MSYTITGASANAAALGGPVQLKDDDLFPVKLSSPPPPPGPPARPVNKNKDLSFQFGLDVRSTDGRTITKFDSNAVLTLPGANVTIKGGAVATLNADGTTSYQSYAGGGFIIKFADGMTLKTDGRLLVNSKSGQVIVEGGSVFTKDGVKISGFVQFDLTNERITLATGELSFPIGSNLRALAGVNFENQTVEFKTGAQVNLFGWLGVTGAITRNADSGKVGAELGASVKVNPNLSFTLNADTDRNRLGPDVRLIGRLAI